MKKDEKKRGMLWSSTETPPTLVATNAPKRKSVPELLKEFIEEMTKEEKGGFIFKWRKARVIIKYEKKLCACAKDEAGQHKNLYKLEDVYKNEFGLKPTTAQRYKCVYRFFDSYVLSEDTGTPTLETLAEIGMSKLDVLISLHKVNPKSWHFTDDGHILLDSSVFEDDKNDVSNIYVRTLREISKKIRVPVVQTDNPIYVDVQSDDESTDNSLSSPASEIGFALLSAGQTHGSLVINGSSSVESGATEGTDNNAGLDRFTIDIWGSSDIKLLTQDGKIRYDDPATDTGYSELVVQTLNCNIAVNDDNTSNRHKVEIFLQDQQHSAYVTLRKPNDGSGDPPDIIMIYFDRDSGTLRYFQSSQIINDHVLVCLSDNLSDTPAILQEIIK